METITGSKGWLLFWLLMCAYAIISAYGITGSLSLSLMGALAGFLAGIEAQMLMAKWVRR